VSGVIDSALKVSVQRLPMVIMHFSAERCMCGAFAGMEDFMLTAPRVQQPYKAVQGASLIYDPAVAE